MAADIIGTIDGALTDWETSPDAMRWTTDEAALEAAPSDEELDVEVVLAVLADMTRVLNAAMPKMQAGFKRMSEQMSALLRDYPGLHGEGVTEAEPRGSIPPTP